MIAVLKLIKINKIKNSIRRRFKYIQKICKMVPLAVEQIAAQPVAAELDNSIALLYGPSQFSAAQLSQASKTVMNTGKEHVAHYIQYPTKYSIFPDLLHYLP